MLYYTLLTTGIYKYFVCPIGVCVQRQKYYRMADIIWKRCNVLITRRDFIRTHFITYTTLLLLLLYLFDILYIFSTENIIYSNRRYNIIMYFEQSFRQIYPLSPKFVKCAKICKIKYYIHIPTYIHSLCHETNLRNFVNYYLEQPVQLCILFC